MDGLTQELVRRLQEAGDEHDKHVMAATLQQGVWQGKIQAYREILQWVAAHPQPITEMSEPMLRVVNGLEDTPETSSDDVH